MVFSILVHYTSFVVLYVIVLFLTTVSVSEAEDNSILDCLISNVRVFAIISDFVVDFIDRLDFTRVISEDLNEANVYSLNEEEGLLDVGFIIDSLC